MILTDFEHAVHVQEKKSLELSPDIFDEARALYRERAASGRIWQSIWEFCPTRISFSREAGKMSGRLILSRYLG